MRQVRGVVQRYQGLVWFEGVFVVVGMSLQFEQDVIRDTVRSIPTVPNTHFLVLSIGEFLPTETVVLNEVDGLQINDREESL